MEGEREFGKGQDILHPPCSVERIKRLHTLVSDVGQQPITLNELKAAITDETAVRIWAATLQANAAMQSLQASRRHVYGGTVIESVKPLAAEWLLKLAKDESPVVRVAAAEGLCYAGKLDEGLAVLIKELGGPVPRVQRHAAIALDELDQRAKPATSRQQFHAPSPPDPWQV